ncbi:MAG: glycoside hydrolase family 13 protein [Bacteroidales bacterium]
MKKLHLSILISIFYFVTFYSNAQTIIRRVEPSNWWTGMADNKLQLLIYGVGISSYQASIKDTNLKIISQNKLESPNYLFIDLEINLTMPPGKFEIKLSLNNQFKTSFFYELKQREVGSANRLGFSNADAIYLLMPDRFANGNPKNDNITGMPDIFNRNDPDARHGGDISGITHHLDYIKDLGTTAIWISPVLENNMKKYSYHGYATTDFYKVDARFGSNEEYKNLIQVSHQKGLKVIMDMIFNHCGLDHWWIKDLPSQDWIHQFSKFTRSNYRSETLMDPYASTIDKTLMSDGWFDTSMPDLNQKNPYLATYLIQNSIWWIEYSGINGIRMDTYPYSDQVFMSKWMESINREYPNFNVVGETWLQRESHTAWFQAGAYSNSKKTSNLKCVTDFPMQSALCSAFNENDGWSEGLARFYYVLAQDFLYPNPQNIVIFADNHDVSRYFSSINQDFEKWKMAMAFLTTCRGIPMIYYGTEILMAGRKDQGDGKIREDFPGGWVEDHQNAFNKEGRTAIQNQAIDYLQVLLNFRKKHPALQNGKLKHYFPTDGTYVYFRYNENENIMVVMNNNNKAITLDLERFQESLNNSKTALDIINQKEIKITKSLTINKKSVLILDLK